MQIKLRDRYLLSIFFKNYLVCLFIVSFLFLLIDVVTTLNRFQVSGAVFLAYYINYLPWIVSQMLPIAGVMATVFLFVGLQKNSELVVFYSLGVSVYRVFAPVLAGLFAASFFGWALTDQVVPYAMEKRNYYYYVEMKKNPGSYNKLKKRNVWFRTPEAIVNFEKVVSETKISGAKVYFYDKEKWQPKEVLEAQEVDLGEDLWVFKNGQRSLYLEGTVQTKPFQEYRTSPLEDLADFKKTQAKLNSMSLSQLSYAISKAKKSSMSSRNLEVEYHAKLSFIFSALFLSLLALPFCIGTQRTTNVFVGLGVSLLLVMLYWVVYSTSLNLGKSGSLSPIVSGWLTGVVSLCISLFLIRRKV